MGKLVEVTAFVVRFRTFLGGTATGRTAGRAAFLVFFPADGLSALFEGESAFLASLAADCCLAGRAVPRFAISASMVFSVESQWRTVCRFTIASFYSERLNLSKKRVGWNKR